MIMEFLLEVVYTKYDDPTSNSQSKSEYHDTIRLHLPL